jgi:hypothetical protein
MFPRSTKSYHPVLIKDYLEALDLSTQIHFIMLVQSLLC